MFVKEKEVAKTVAPELEESEEEESSSEEEPEKQEEPEEEKSKWRSINDIWCYRERASEVAQQEREEEAWRRRIWENDEWSRPLRE